MLSPLDPSAQLVLGKGIDRTVDMLTQKVIRRWADFRARRFVYQFVERVAAYAPGGGDPQELERFLERILENESHSAALYEAFRHVLLAASREIGPRVIGLHMAEVIAGEVNDAEISDMVMSGASLLLDFEFEAFVQYASSNGVEAQPFKESQEEVIVVTLRPVEFDSSWKVGRKETGPVNLRLEAGSWAQKLQQVGLVTQDVSEEEFDYDVDEDRHIDQPGTVRRIHRNIEFREGTSHLFRLTRMATDALKSKKE